MKRWTSALPAVLILAACGSAPAAGDVASASRTPTLTAHDIATAGAWPGAADAVLVDLASSRLSYSVSLVSGDGGVARQMTALKRTPIVTPHGIAIQLPYVSMTRASLYYLDGDAVVHA